MEADSERMEVDLESMKVESNMEFDYAKTFTFLLSQSLTGWLSTFVIGISTYIVINLLFQRSRLPPGPFPLPILGNLLSFNGKTPKLTIIENYQKLYGNVFTLWLGNKPHIVVSGWDLTKEVLITKKDEFSGRPHSIAADNMLQGSHDIAFSDTSRTNIILKKMGSNAVRKYINTQNFVDVVYDNAMDLVSKMLKQKGPFDPEDWLYEMLCSIMEVIAFGDGEKTGKYVFKIKGALKAFEEQTGNGFPSDFLPILTPFYWGRENIIHHYFKLCLDNISNKVKEHKAVFKKDDIKDFVDAVLSSREEADESDKSLITDKNILGVILNLFLASVSTTHQTISWLLLEMANNPDLQNRVYNEINEKIGGRMPVPKDKDLCPYTSAVISEVLRIRVPVPVLLPHKTTCNTTIGDYKIPKGVAVLVNAADIHLNEKAWKDPHVFKPERFMDKEGNYTNERLTHYVPFGLGRRSCPGEKMARADIFMIFVTLLQKCEISLENGPGTANFARKDTIVLSFTEPFNIIVKPRK